MEIVVWIGLSQSLFAALIIATKRDRSISDKILSAWLFLFAISFLLSGIDYQVFKHPMLTNAFLLINPAFYLYIRSLTQRNFRLKWIQLLHLFPFILFEVYTQIFRQPLSDQSLLFEPGTGIFSGFFISIALLSWVGYNLASIIIVHRHRRNLENEFSTIESYLKIGWILLILSLYITFCFVVLGIGIYSYFSEAQILITHNATYSGFLVFVYILSYYGLIQRRIFIRQSNEEIPAKYEKSVLSEKKKNEIKTAIIRYFDKEKPYLNPELNMDLLSEHTGIPKHQITEVLNTLIGKNFFMFVNTYRVDAVKEKLKDKSNPYSIEALGYDCGFSSKSSFYTVFKKITGLTPMQFRNLSG